MMEADDKMTKKEHTFWMGIRQVLIMMIGLVEDYLGLERSIVPRRKRPYEPKTEHETDQQVG
jgi:hypothetical protein